MFTGIVTAIGHIVDAQPLGAEQTHGSRLTIETPAAYLDDVQPGDSIALNGACIFCLNSRTRLVSFSSPV